MDLKGNSNSKRISSHEDDNSMLKKFRSSTSSGFGSEGGTVSVSEGERCFVELWSQMKPLLTQLVQVEVKRAIHSLAESLRGGKETEEEVMVESKMEKFKLVFCNEISSTIFTNNEIRAENGDPLRVEISDATTNEVICTDLLSSAQIEFFVLDGEYGSGTLSDFKKSVLSPRDGKRPLIVGSDHRLNLENGVAFIQNLCITDNSSWIKSKKFRLGAKIIDDNVLAKCPNIGVAVSQPFRVRDHRGEVNKKRHPPSMDDEVWRLKGIGKDGTYHKNLSSRDINNVGDFIKAYHEMGSTVLRKLLGTKVPKKIWKMMIDNALECTNVVPSRVMGSDEANKSIEGFEQFLCDLGIPQGRMQEGFENGLGYYDSIHQLFEESHYEEQLTKLAPYNLSM